MLAARQEGARVHVRGAMGLITNQNPGTRLGGHNLRVALDCGAMREPHDKEKSS